MSPPSTPDVFPPRTAYEEMIILKVGEGKHEKMFWVHRDVLRFHSEYFHAALDARWRPDANNIYELSGDMPGHEPEVLSVFAKWLYTHRLEVPIPDSEDDYTEFDMLCYLWVFADAHQVPMLQNQLIDLFYARLSLAGVCANGCIEYVYDNTPPGSALRRFVVDHLVKFGDPRTVMSPDRQHLFSRDALIDIARALFQEKAQAGQYAPGWDICELYHVHEDGVRCIR